MTSKVNGPHALKMQTSFVVGANGQVTLKSPSRLGTKKLQTAAQPIFQAPRPVAFSSAFDEATPIQFSPLTGLPIPNPEVFSILRARPKAVPPSPETPGKTGGTKRKELPAETSPSKKTPERPANRSAKIMNTPSPITPSRVSLIAPGVTASPMVLREPCDYHDLDRLLTRVKKQEIRGFKGKKEHTVVEVSPTKRIKQAVLVEPAVQDYVLKVSKAIEQGSTEKFPPLQVSPQTQVRVSKSRIAEIQHQDLVSRRKVKREYGIHRRADDSKMGSYFPTGKGHKTYSFRKDSSDVPSPKDLLSIVDGFRSTSKRVSPSEYFKQEYAKLTPSPTNTATN